MSITINQIIGKDRVFGKLCYEAEYCYKHKNYFAALACLFVTSEQIIKHATNKIDGNFFQAILNAKEKNLIDETEFKLINALRKLRNKIFHENHYSTGLEINGIHYSFDEDETKEIVYTHFSQKLFDIVLRLA